MPKLFDEAEKAASCSAYMPVEELLLFMADEERGCKPEAMDVLLAMDFDSIFPVLEQAVRNDDQADLRNSAMEMMVRFGRQAVPKLLVLLRDDNEEVRNFSTVMLGDICSSEAVVPLIKALSDEDVNVRHGAAEALGKIGDRSALVPLLALLKEDFWQQYPAVAAIAAMRDIRAVPHLVKLLGNSMLDGAVIDALGEIGDPRALTCLVKLIDDSDMIITGKIVQAIVKIYRNIEDDCRYKNIMAACHQADLKKTIGRNGVEKIRCLIEPGEASSTVKAAITLLGWLGESSMLPAFFLLLDNDEYLESVEGSVLAMEKDAVPELVKGLQHRSDTVRSLAVRLLRWLGEALDPEAVIPLLLDTCEKVQVEILESLKGITLPEALPRLFELLEHDDEEIRYLSAQVLGVYTYSQLQGFLEQMISSPRAFSRKCAAALIGAMNHTVSHTVLGFLMKDPDPDVRKEAVASAGRLEETAMLPYLTDALSDADPAVQEEAVRSLAGFGNDAPLQKILSLLKSERECLDYAVVLAVGEIGAGEGGEALVDYLQDGKTNRCLEFTLMDTLGKIGYKPAASIISKRYLHHEDSDFRRRAVQALGEISDPDSVQTVAAACRDPHWSVKIAALGALVKINGQIAFPVIVDALNDPDQMVRKNAIQLLGDLRDIHAISKLIGFLTDPELGKYAFEALLKLGRPVLPWLHRVMRGDYQLEVREMAIALVGKIGDRKSIETLIGMLDDPMPVMRLAAIDSLVFCYDSLPLKKLYRVIRSDDDAEVREKAFLAMQTLTSENFFP